MPALVQQGAERTAWGRFVTASAPAWRRGREVNDGASGWRSPVGVLAFFETVDEGDEQAHGVFHVLQVDDFAGRVHVAQRDADQRAISLWVYQNVQCVGSLRLAESLAMMIQQAKDYDRLKPIPDNRLGGESFDIPAPADLVRGLVNGHHLYL